MSAQVHSSGGSRWSGKRFVPMAEIELAAFFSERRTLVSSLLLEPVVQLVLLAAGLQGLLATRDDFYNGHSYLAFVLPGLIGLQALRGFNRTMYRTVLDRQWGMLTIKRLAGAGGLGYAASKIVAPIAALLAQIIALVALALLMGVDLHLVNVVLCSLIAVCAVAFWAAIAIVITGYVRDYVVRDMVVSWMMLPLSLAAPVFYQLESAPTYLRWLAAINPLAWQVNALRSALLDGVVTTTALVTSGLTVGAVVVAIISVSAGDALVSEGGR